MPNRRKHALLFITFIVFLFSCSSTKNITQEIKTNVTPEKSDLLYQEIERLGLELTKREHVPGLAVSVIRNGKIAWIQCIGYADMADKKPVTELRLINT